MPYIPEWVAKLGAVAAVSIIQTILFLWAFNKFSRSRDAEFRKILESRDEELRRWGESRDAERSRFLTIMENQERRFVGAIVLLVDMARTMVSNCQAGVSKEQQVTSDDILKAAQAAIGKEQESASSSS
jgi:hypothetical protein